MYKIFTFTLVLFLLLQASEAQWKPGDPLVDERDGQIYKTVKIGQQVWMAENLNYGQLIPSTKAGYEMSDNGIVEKYCWEDDNGNCDGSDGKMKRGGFYEWMEAVQYWQGQPDLPVQGVCPNGWHIPSNDEWNELLNGQGGATAYTKLVVGGGSGFDALLTGYRCTMTGGFRVSATAADTRTYFWTAEETDAKNAPFLELGQNSLTSMSFYKSLGLCIRCIWDGEQPDPEPGIQLNKNSLDFESVLIGETVKLDLEITNSGDATLTISSLELIDENSVFTLSGDLSGEEIAPGEKRTLSVFFKPTNEMSYTGELVINSNAVNDSNLIVGLNGIGYENNGEITCNKEAIDFGETDIGFEKTEPLELTNTGSAGLEISSIELEEDTDGVFNINNISLPVIIEPLAKLMIDVSFLPMEEKSFTANLRITSNAVNNSELEIGLSGSGKVVSSVEGAVYESNGISLKLNPNPMNSSAVLTYCNQNGSGVSLNIYLIDINGNKVMRLVDAFTMPGEYNIDIDTHKLASGKYFIIAESGKNLIRLPVTITR